MDYTKRKPRWSKFRLTQLVGRAKYFSGNNRYDADRFPKGHWMRTDLAKETWARKNYGKYTRGCI